MKWKHTPIPKEGEQRERIIFALLPRVCSDGFTRWFEKVQVREVARNTYDGDSCYYIYWHEWEVNPL